MNVIYRLSRLLLTQAALLGGYCIGALILLGWPASGILLGLLAFLRASGRGHKRLTTLGSARWAEKRDLQKAGMLNAKSGLILGRMPGKARLGPGVSQLLNWSVGSSEACRQFWSGRQKSVVRLPKAVHTAVFAPTGVGKGVSCILPFLLNSDESCVVLDFKGELARITAEHRRKAFGHKVVLLDPYQSVTRTPDTFNPLDFMDKNDRLAIDECNDLASALVVRTGDERDPHWSDSAEAYISAVMTTVVAYGETRTRSLQTVREILSLPQKHDLAIKLMMESDMWGGLLAQMGGQLLHFTDKEKSSVLSSALRHLRFLGTPAVVASTSESSFDPSELRKGRMSIFMILSPDRAKAQAGLLRMWIGSLLRACVRGGLQ
jgi:type IV secretion system protein VirD4